MGGALRSLGRSKGLGRQKFGGSQGTLQDLEIWGTHPVLGGPRGLGGPHCWGAPACSEPAFGAPHGVGVPVIRVCPFLLSPFLGCPHPGVSPSRGVTSCAGPAGPCRSPAPSAPSGPAGRTWAGPHPARLPRALGTGEHRGHAGTGGHWRHHGGVAVTETPGVLGTSGGHGNIGGHQGPQ